MSNTPDVNELIPIDERTDSERLGILLSIGHECTRLDYKEVIDLSKKNKEERVKFAKDIVSMANHYPGGYIVIGATDDGKPSAIADQNNWDLFDAAVLNQLLGQYIDTSVTIISQPQDYDDHKYCVICVKAPNNGYIIPFAKEGAFSKNGKPKETVFRAGDITRRVNAQNVIVKFSDWPEILAHHDEQVRKGERKVIDDLMRRVTAALSEHGKLPPLELGMPEEAVAKALHECFTQNGIAQVRRFMSQVKSQLDAEQTSIYDLAAIACYAALYKNSEVLNDVLDALYDHYRKYAFPNVENQRMTDIAVVLYVIGSAVVRSKMWDVISPMVNRPGIYQKQYASWLRFAQVMASDSVLNKSGREGLLITAALERIRTNVLLRPDSPPDSDWSQIEDMYLDSLCSFDFLYCACVFMEGEGGGQAYPGCSRFYGKRTRGVLVDMLTNTGGMRDRLLTKPITSESVEALKELFGRMQREALRYNGWFADGMMSDAFDRFLQEFSQAE